MQDLTALVKGLSPQKQKALAVLLRQKGINLFGVIPISRQGATDRSALSYAQRRQWILWQLEPESSAYHIPMVLRLRGQVDLGAMQKALDALVIRHETLRTVFVQENDDAVQVIQAAAPIPIDVEDLTSLEAELPAQIGSEIDRPFNLETGPLLRVKLLRESSDSHVLVMVMHHIVSDDWSMHVMVDELVALYGGYSRGQAAELPDLPIQYADYAIWQRNWMEAGEREAQLSYWLKQLGGEDPLLELPLDRARPSVRSHRGAQLEVPLSRAISAGLSQFAQREGATVFMVLLASFQALLHRYSGQNDIRVGVPIANRNRVETEQLIGFFVNTQVLKAEVDSQTPFRALLLQTKQTVLDAQAHQDLPFDQLVEALHPERSMSHSPLFQVMMNHLTEGRERSAIVVPGLRIEPVESQAKTAQFDLTLDTSESPEGIHAAFTYATDIFDAATIERLAKHWQSLLEGILADPQQRVGELRLLSHAEVRQQLVEWNAAEVAYPVESCVHERIEAQAERRPDSVALTLGAEHLSYRELNEKANRLAHRLIELGVGPEVRVGVATERSLETIIGFLATLKAGGAYVPLDPEYPADRLRYMLEDSGVALLLTQSFLTERLPIPPGLQVLKLDQSESYGDKPSNPITRVHLENLAYVIYTSGSTGKPKGVVVSHGPLSMHIEALADCYVTSEADCELQFMSFAFDGAHEHWLKALTRGARMVLRGGELWTPEETYAALHDYGATVTVLPPVYLLQLAQHAESAGKPPAMRIYCFGGDAVPDASFELAKRTLNPEHIINGYGPTETVVTPLLWKASGEMRCGAAYAPIGSRVGDRSAYVLDANLELLPVGLSGELYLGGYGVARGYHNRASLTAERFVPDPFSEKGERLYRSGDLTRLRPDGVVDYVGRVDYQVKIRGFRIELGEIEARLQDHEDVGDAVVVAHDGPSGKQLVGYVVAREGDIDPATLCDRLRTALKSELPDYMVPSHLMVLPQLPLTPNGKLNRKALPKPDASALQKAYVEPQTELQRRIAAIWSDVLKLERIGLTDNFFELGGDSIVSIQVVSRARHAGIRFTPKDLFQHQTVQGLASVAQVGGEGFAIDQGPVRGELPLLPIQRWFFEQAISERQHWNQSVVLRPSQDLRAEVLERAIAALVEHHDALRLGFHASDGGWTAIHRPLEDSRAATYLWSREIEDASELTRVGTEAQRSLDLERGPLLRVVLAHLADGSQRLVLAIHHLVVDGVSWRVLLEDLQTVYPQLESGRTLELPAKTSAYKLWAEKLQGYARSPALQAELNHWEAQLAGGHGALPCDHPEGGLQSRHGTTVNTLLRADSTKKLLKQAPSTYRTQINDLLLTALARVISRWTGEESALLQLEGHGREDLFDDVDLSRTVGWFTTMYPVMLTPAAEIADSIKAIKEQLRAVPNKGIGFGVLRAFGDEATKRRLNALPSPAITFNYLGQFDSSFDGEAGLFTPSGESPGPEQSADAPLGNELSLNGQVYGGELSLDWTFSSERFDVATIQKLADDYRQELEALIAHCCDAAHGGVTPSDFPLLSATQAELDALPLPATQIEDLYPLSPMQQGMLFHTLYDDSGDYINQLRVDVDGLDADRFRSAWQAAVEAHDILRTGFLWQGEFSQPIQLVHRHVEVPFTQRDWRTQPELAAALDALAEGERKQGFDPSRAPLFRLVLVQTGETRHHLIYTNHHSLMDGWSNSQLLGEVLSRYSNQPLSESIGRYRDYIGWLQRQDAAATEAFWKSEVAELEQPTRLATAFQGAPSEATGYGEHLQLLDADDTRRLNAYARQQKVTVNTIVQAAWQLLLQRYTGQAAVAFGATVSGRPADLPGIEQQIGLFINTLPVVSTPRAEQRVSEWLQALQAKNVSLREYEHTSLADIQRWAGQSGESLFDTLLVFENYPVSEALEQGPAGAVRFGNILELEQTNYPLTVAVGSDEKLLLRYAYARAHFSDQTIEHLADHWRNLLDGMLSDPSKRIGELQLLSEGEQRAQLIEWKRVGDFPRLGDAEQWNDTNRGPYPLDAGYASLFERQVDAVADRVVASCLDETWTYRELDERANRVGHALVQAGAVEDEPIALLGERGLALLGMMIGSFKAGAGYLALDPDLPDARLVEVLESGATRVLLTLRAHVARATQLTAAKPIRLLVWEDIQTDAYSVARLAVDSGAQHLAYVIYTSGSTGKPKGVVVEQAGMLNNQLSKVPYLQLTERDVIAQTASQSFDISVWQFLTAALCGARVDIVPNATAHDPRALLEHLRDRRITVLESVPSLIQAFLEESAVSLDHLRWLLPTGEAMSPELARRWLTRYPAIALVNAYGPAECSDDVSLYRVEEPPSSGTSLPIGSATDNNQLYVLHDDLQLAPVGAVGELYVSGTGVGRGYLNDPSRTAAAFFPNPFSDSGDRLYRTGDLARRRSDGVLEYLGRVDHQVKIRGFRIELGEIEARLLDRDDIREAIVVAHDGPTGKQLVGYVVPRESVDEATLRGRLRAALTLVLPDYMVPAHFVVLEKLPLTANGKVDRRALHKPEASALQKTYIAPQTPTQKQLASIWADVLKLDRVGLNDNFFELGGDSLLSIQLVSRARKLGLHFSPKDLFQHQTIGGLASVLEIGKERLAIAQSPVTGEMPLLPIQRWFFDREIPKQHSWTQAVTLRPMVQLRAEHLDTAVQAILEHHDALRLSFRKGRSGWTTVHRSIEDNRKVPVFSSVEIQAFPELTRLGDEAQKSLSLDDGPLVRVVLASLPDGNQRLIAVIHHLVVDGVSWRVLLEDLQTAYQQAESGQPIQLPEKTTAYKTWSEQLQQFAQTESLEYWKAQLQDGPATLPCDHTFGSMRTRDAVTVHTQLTASLTKTLLQEAPAAYQTQISDLLLTALARVIARWTSQPSALIQLEGHGREELVDDVDLSRTVGWFTTMYPVRLTPSAEIGASIQAVKQQLRTIPNRGIGFGALTAYGDVATQRVLRGLPAPKITFSYLGQVDDSSARTKASFEPTDEYVSADNLDAPLSNELVVTGQVFAGELSFAWIFSGARFEIDTIQRLANDYRMELEALIAHTAALATRR